MSFERIIPQDIKFEYYAEKFTEIRRIFDEQSRLSYSEFLFLTALVGININESVQLDTQKGTGDYTISRTVYSRNSTLLDTYYGLITILANAGLEYDYVINELAFVRTTDNGPKYIDMINVKTFYSFFLGGIEKLYDLINEYDRKSDIDVFDSIYDVVEAEEKSILAVYDTLAEAETIAGEMK